MSEFLLSGRITAESEFNGGSGACGPCALAAAARWSTQRDTFTARSLTAQLVAWGLCGATGISDTPQLRQAAQKLGFTIANPNKGETMQHFAGLTLQAADGALLGAVVLQLENGQALKDYVTTANMDATNLHGHFITLVGYNSGGFSPWFGLNVPQGFIAADGDNILQNPLIGGARVHRQLNTQLCYYPLTVILAAQPYDAFSILPQAHDPLSVALGKLSAIQHIMES